MACSHGRYSHPLPPVVAERLTGPEIGQVVRYSNPSFPQWDGLLMLVRDRSYVWSPGECSAGGGYRRYDWTVVSWPVLGRWGAVRWESMVVDDDRLTVVAP